MKGLIEVSGNATLTGNAYKAGQPTQCRVSENTGTSFEITNVYCTLKPLLVSLQIVGLYFNDPWIPSHGDVNQSMDAILRAKRGTRWTPGRIYIVPVCLLYHGWGLPDVSSCWMALNHSEKCYSENPIGYMGA